MTHNVLAEAHISPKAQNGWKTAFLAMLTGLIAFTGCVTPIEVKQASKAQLDLLTNLDNATNDLQQSITQLQQSMESRIRENGRIWIAKQAIEVAYPEANPDKMVIADDLFKGHKASIQPWIDYAFIADESINAKIAQIEERLKKVTDPALIIQLNAELQNWTKLRDVDLKGKPPKVQQIEAVIMDDIKGSMAARATIEKGLEILRAQIAVMKQAATRIDTWLAINVTVTQEQADSLRQAISAAATSLGGGK